MTINCKGKLIALDTPKCMGILNVTPDSFYDGGKYKSDASFLNQTERMLTEGATFIDIGAYSSRPNAEFVTEQEEIDRIVPVIRLIADRFPEAILSVDTFRAKVASEAIGAGAAIINDIAAGLLDENMLPTVGELKVPYIMMHMRGTPQTMATLTDYNDIVKEMLYYFSERARAARSYGIQDIIIDPGFGFAKTTEQNYEVLQKLELFQILELPLLSAVSRKSMIYKVLENTPAEALNGTTVLNTLSLLKGASILRVHDVKEAMECIRLVTKTQGL
ncbi:dihydropteroate synthase [Flavobacterium cerinum]|uniref:dihydropteroate synthase n=1 Tax=Flavobacterium cerinum TaxID=2502784 RepID=A0ABY5IV98_9FLAO|nr:dihydropteroate synthase [Flavobacterium cerinum]UUC45452.1 dihydropteroate synthase [Flavobacterium cerinum]